MRFVRELPLAELAYSELIYRSAGIVRTLSSGIDSSPREASFSVNVLRSTANNFLLDGLDNNYFGTSKMTAVPTLRTVISREPQPTASREITNYRYGWRSGLLFPEQFYVGEGD